VYKHLHLHVLAYLVAGGAPLHTDWKKTYMLSTRWLSIHC